MHLGCAKAITWTEESINWTITWSLPNSQRWKISNTILRPSYHPHHSSYGPYHKIAPEQPIQRIFRTQLFNPSIEFLSNKIPHEGLQRRRIKGENPPSRYWLATHCPSEVKSHELNNKTLMAHDISNKTIIQCINLESLCKVLKLLLMHASKSKEKDESTTNLD